MDRRTFLRLIGCTTLTLAAGGLEPGSSWVAWAATEGLSGGEEQTFSAAVYRIIPHESPALKALVGKTVSSLQSKMANDAKLKGNIESVVSALNEKSEATYGKRFAELIPDDQIIVMEQVESTPAFQAVINQVLGDYYDRSEVWNGLGYPGPVNDHAHELGGYLETGYDKLDW